MRQMLAVISFNQQTFVEHQLCAGPCSTAGEPERSLKRSLASKNLHPRWGSQQERMQPLDSSAAGEASKVPWEAWQVDTLRGWRTNSTSKLLMAALLLDTCSARCPWKLRDCGGDLPPLASPAALEFNLHGDAEQLHETRGLGKMDSFHLSHSLWGHQKGKV